MKSDGELIRGTGENYGEPKSSIEHFAGWRKSA
jgi:hypothetical protein